MDNGIDAFTELSIDLQRFHRKCRLRSRIVDRKELETESYTTTVFKKLITSRVFPSVQFSLSRKE